MPKGFHSLTNPQSLSHRTTDLSQRYIQKSTRMPPKHNTREEWPTTPKRVPHPRLGYLLSLLDLRITWQVPLPMTNPINFLNQPLREDQDLSGKLTQSSTNLLLRRRMMERFLKEAPISSLKGTRSFLQESPSKLKKVFLCHLTKIIWKGDKPMSPTWRKELSKIWTRQMNTSMWSDVGSRWDRAL